MIILRSYSKMQRMNKITGLSFIISSAALGLITGILYLNLSGSTVYQSRILSASSIKLNPTSNKDHTEEDIKGILHTASGTWSVVVWSAGPTPLVEINGAKSYHAASTMKLLTAVATYRLLTNSDYTLDTTYGNTTVKNLLESMINQSNNDSWAALNELVGLSAIQQVALDNQMLNTDVYENTTTGHDLTLFLHNLYFGDLLAMEQKKHLLSLMQNTETENRLPQGFSAQIELYHKSGTLLPEAFHDIGIVKGDHNTVVISILGEKTTEPEGTRIIHTIAKVLEKNVVNPR